MIEKVCIILLGSIIFFAKTINYKYASDDIPSSRIPHSKPAWKHWLMVLESSEKSHPQADHLITTLIHSLVCVFIYLGFGANEISFLAAFLFMVNPINNQGSVWISGRSYAYSTLGMTAAMALPFLAPLFLLGAAYFNAGFAVPIIFIVSPHPLIALWVPAIWLFHGKRFKRNVGDKIKKEMFVEDRKIHPRKLVLMIKTFGFYTFHALFPIKTAFYHSFLQSAAGSGKAKALTMKDRFFWIGLASIMFIVYYLLFFPWTLASFGLIWWCICLLPFLNLFRIQQEIAERYCYLPNVGLMFFLASYIQAYPVVSAFFLSVYATKLWFYMDNYQDDYYLVEGSCLHSPDAWFSWHVKGLKRWDSGSHKEAVILWTMARMISPNEFKINFNLATAMKLAKQDKDAEMLINHAKNNVPAGQEESSKNLLDEWFKGNLTILL